MVAMAEEVSSTAVPGSRRSRAAASVSEKTIASNWPVASENCANAYFDPFWERRSREETTIAASRPATAPRSSRCSNSA